MTLSATNSPSQINAQFCRPCSECKVLLSLYLLCPNGTEWPIRMQQNICQFLASCQTQSAARVRLSNLPVWVNFFWPVHITQCVWPDQPVRGSVNLLRRGKDLWSGSTSWTGRPFQLVTRWKAYARVKVPSILLDSTHYSCLKQRGGRNIRTMNSTYQLKVIFTLILKRIKYRVFEWNRD